MTPTETTIRLPAPEGWQQKDANTINQGQGNEDWRHIHAYDRGGFCWQVMRSGMHTSGYVETLEQAFAKSDEYFFGDIEHHKHYYLTGLLAELEALHKKLADQGVDARAADYRIGFQAGRVDMQQHILATVGKMADGNTASVASAC